MRDLGACPRHSNFGRNVKTKIERTRGKRPRVQQFCSTYRDIRDIESFFLRNVQGTEEFVRAIEKFEKLSIQIFESQLCNCLLYLIQNLKSNFKFPYMELRNRIYQFFSREKIQ